MKKVLFLLIVLSCFCVTAAFAVDGGALYKKRCAKCHRDGSESSPAGGGVILKGQSSAEIEEKLNGYLDEIYGGNKKVLMTRMLKSLKSEDIKALSDYIGSL